MYSADVHARGLLQLFSDVNDATDWFIEVLNVPLMSVDVHVVAVFDGDSCTFRMDDVGCQSRCARTRCASCCLCCPCSLLLPLHNMQHVREVGRDVAVCL